MTSRQFAIAYGATAAVFLALDAVWLSAHGGSPVPAGPRATSWLERFALAPAHRLLCDLHRWAWWCSRWPPRCRQRQLAGGARLGRPARAVAYATYDLTNQATLKDWPWPVTLADLRWGTCP